MSFICKELLKVSPSEAKVFIDSFDSVMADCDGVLWNGAKAIPGSPEVIQKLRDLGKKVFYCTNNSTKSRTDYVEKVTALGFGGDKEEIVGTSYLAASYLKQIGYKGKVYAIGSEGVSKELDEVGIPYIGIGRDEVPENWTYASADDLIKDLDSEVQCVVCGFDFHFSYFKLAKACTVLNRPGSIFIGTNTDEQFPCQNGAVLPGTGAIVNALATASERQPIVMGKPNKMMFEVVKGVHPEINPERTLMIGDRANTDILLGKNCDLMTLMVGSGVHSLEDIRRWENSGNPEQKRMCADYYLPSLGDLLQFL